MAKRKELIDKAESLARQHKEVIADLEALDEKRKKDVERINEFLSVDLCGDYFCGTIIDKVEIVELLKFILEKDKPAKIPFNLYYEEK